jgi:stage V sporulation protein S
MKCVRVSKDSAPAQVAGAIAGILREDGEVLVQAMGAAAVNQMAKATAVARRFMIDEGSELSLQPRLETSDDLTRVIFEVKKIG